jgi:hypothetical protein
MNTENEKSIPVENVLTHEDRMLSEQVQQTKYLESISKNVQFFAWITILSLVAAIIVALIVNQPN